ncbi:MAG: 6-carboxytetrahydropterin synthase QueD [Planctomycetes bacterium]|nr:6-carboxytetrahydropterin synthase QueD [Planctomycetota bacterium]
MQIFRDFTFEAAHFLPNVPDGHKCKRLHGHSYRARIHVRGVQQPHTNWVMDFAELKRLVEPIIDSLDHRTLNDIPGLENPTAEQITRYLWTHIKAAVPGLAEITLHETAKAGCTYRGEDE